MTFAVLGTGMVGRTLAGKLAQNGHDVALGTRDPDATRARTAPNQQPLADWLAAHPTIRLARFADASAGAEIVLVALSGQAALDVLGSIDKDVFTGRIVVDITNPLDFSKGMPPSLFVSNTDSLAETLQRALPGARVVKTLNTVNANVMVDPGRVAGGDHTMFVCGNDEAARLAVAEMLGDEFGWRDIVDLGDLTGARAMESYLHLWLRLWGAVGTPDFSIKLMR